MTDREKQLIDAALLEEYHSVCGGFAGWLRQVLIGNESELAARIRIELEELERWKASHGTLRSQLAAANLDVDRLAIELDSARGEVGRLNRVVQLCSVVENGLRDDIRRLCALLARCAAALEAVPDPSATDLTLIEEAKRGS